MHQQSLMLLHPTVKEKMHLQENTLVDHDLRVEISEIFSTQQEFIREYGRADGRSTDRLLFEMNIPFLLMKKAGIIKKNV